jgi:cytochrome c5
MKGLYMKYQSKSYLFIVILILFFLHIPLVSAEEAKNTKKDFLHFGNMGGLLPTLEIDDLADSNSPGAKMVFFYCSQCHNAPGPGMHTEKEWNHTFWKMYWRMHLMNAQFKNFQVPTYSDGEIMYRYLKKYALNSVKAANINDKTTGAKEFLRLCMQCHNLPNPKTHFKDDWPEVVKRMRRHMNSMGKRIASPQEIHLITEFLKKQAKK